MTKHKLEVMPDGTWSIKWDSWAKTHHWLPLRNFNSPLSFFPSSDAKNMFHEPPSLLSKIFNGFLIPQTRRHFWNLVLDFSGIKFHSWPTKIWSEFCNATSESNHKNAICTFKGTFNFTPNSNILQVQWPPLNKITLGQLECDNNIRLLTFASSCCVNNHVKFTSTVAGA